MEHIGRGIRHWIRTASVRLLQQATAQYRLCHRLSGEGDGVGADTRRTEMQADVDFSPMIEESLISPLSRFSSPCQIPLIQ